MYRWFSRTSDLKVQLIALALGIIAVSVVFVAWMFVGGLSNSDWWKTLGYPGVFHQSLFESPPTNIHATKTTLTAMIPSARAIS
jgi:hypothetical protein